VVALPVLLVLTLVRRRLVLALEVLSVLPLALPVLALVWLPVLPVLVLLSLVALLSLALGLLLVLLALVWLPALPVASMLMAVLVLAPGQRYLNFFAEYQFLSSGYQFLWPVVAIVFVSLQPVYFCAKLFLMDVRLESYGVQLNRL
jgi:hypothetical protein